jgi:hypothetical protein
MVDLSPDPANDDEPGRHSVEAWLTAGPAAEPDDTWSDEPPPPLASPSVRGIHSGQTRWFLVGAGVVIVVAVTVAAALWPHSPAPQLTAALQTSAAAPTTTHAHTPTAVPTTTTAPVQHTTTKRTTPQWTTLTIQATKVWRRGDVVQTNRTKLTLQSNGDLVIIDEFGNVRWHSDTAGRGNIAVFQSDGRLVVYDQRLRILWASSDNQQNGAQLVLQANGDVDIISRGGRTIWSADTAH